MKPNKEFFDLVDKCKLTGVCEMFEGELFEFYNQAMIQLKNQIMNSLNEEYDVYAEKYKDMTSDFNKSYLEGAMDAIDTCTQTVEYNIQPVEVRYRLNWMGPINGDWIKTNGHGWAAGRIDTDYGYPYPAEIGVGTMKAEDWNNLREWLRTYKTFGLQTLDVIVGDFESQTGHKITWFSETKE